MLDLLLPGLDGLEVLRRAAPREPEVPVLILSARADLPTKLRGFELGAADYMSKPFALDELLARVRVQLAARDLDDDARRCAAARRPRPRAASGAPRRTRLRPLRPRVPAAPPPRRCTRAR